MAIQSVIFNKNIYSKLQAKAWLTNHGFLASYKGKSPYTQSINFWRFRQTDPKKYKNYVNKDVAKGIIYVIGF
jgi:hypothetical protein